MALSKLAEPSPKTTYASFLFYVIHTNVQLQSVVGLQFIILYKGREGGIGSEIKACTYDVALLFVLSLFFFFPFSFMFHQGGRVLGGWCWL